MKTVMGTKTKEPLELNPPIAAKNNGTPPDDPALIAQKEFDGCTEQLVKLKAARSTAIEQHNILGGNIERSTAQIKALEIQKEVTGRFLDRMKAWGDYKALPTG